MSRIFRHRKHIQLMLGLAKSETYTSSSMVSWRKEGKIRKFLAWISARKEFHECFIQGMENCAACRLLPGKKMKISQLPLEIICLFCPWLCEFTSPLDTPVFVRATKLVLYTHSLSTSHGQMDTDIYRKIHIHTLSKVYTRRTENHTKGLSFRIQEFSPYSVLV